jgi:putative oxidoreductase
MPMILNPFPSFLLYAFYAPFILRLVIALVFIEFGFAKLTKDKSSKAEFFEKIGLKPGKTFVIVFGLIELVAGAMLLVGFYTQIAALVAGLILLACSVIKVKHSSYLMSPTRYYVVLLIICISLLLTGAGAFALDTPL